ncbi:DsbC family protein [Frateuria aurantia]
MQFQANIKRWWPALAIFLPMLACAQAQVAASSPEMVVRQALLAASPGLKIDSITPAPLPGFHQVIARGRMVYVRDDGRYMFDGRLVALAAPARDLSQPAWSAFRRQQLATIPAADRIIFAPVKPRYRVTVFTDVTCGFCRELHRHIAEINQLGIEVDYVAWPREGLLTTAGRPTPVATEMDDVWCATDRKATYEAALMRAEAPPAAHCASPVQRQYAVGTRIGVSGTPTIIAEDGRELGGYLAPQALLQALRNSGGGGR